MSTNEEKILVIANVGDERRSEGFVTLHSFSPPEKIHQALKKLGLFWGLALFSILIPVFHFVLVPLFLILGIFFSYRSHQSTGRVLSGTAHCPHCQTEVQLKPAELHWPLTEICQNCARLIRIDKK